MKKVLITISVIFLLGLIIIVPVLTPIILLSNILTDDEETNMQLFCSGTGDYNKSMIDEKFNSYLDEDGNRVNPVGALSDKQNLFYKHAKKFNIDAVLMMAIALHETGNGTSNAVVNYNNPAGLMSGSKLMKFATLDKGIEAQGRTLHNRMIRDGKKTIIELSKVYAPIGAANDPNNLNKFWVENVSNFVMALGGVKNCDVLGAVGEVIMIGSGEYVIPTVDGFRVTSHFQSRYSPITGALEFHNGTDLACSKASPIVAFTDGKVKYVEDKISRWSTTLGNYIIVEHGKGVTTWYGHLEPGTSKVMVGQSVKAGQQIAGCGTTGYSTGYHLHFSVRIDKQYIDPYPYLTGSKAFSDLTD